MPQRLDLDVRAAHDGNDPGAARQLAACLLESLRTAGFPTYGGRDRLSSAAVVHVLVSSDGKLNTHVYIDSTNNDGSELLTRFTTSQRDGEHSIEKTAAAIVSRIRFYYTAQGWQPGTAVAILAPFHDEVTAAANK